MTIVRRRPALLAASPEPMRRCTRAGHRLSMRLSPGELKARPVRLGLRRPFQGCQLPEGSSALDDRRQASPLRDLEHRPRGVHEAAEVATAEAKPQIHESEDRPNERAFPWEAEDE